MGRGRNTQFNTSYSYEVKNFTCKCGFSKTCSSQKQLQLSLKMHEKNCSGENANPDFRFIAPIATSLARKGRVSTKIVGVENEN